MSLVPIIYTSLLITGGFLLFVIITSYITYKVKNSNSSVKLATARAATLNLPDNYSSEPQKIAISRRMNKISEKPESHIRETNSAPNHKMHNSESIKKSIHSTKSIKPRISIVETKSSENTMDHMRKSTAGKMHKRIEIVNPNNTAFSINDRNQNPTSNLNDGFTDYYNDDTNEDFYTLKSAGIV